MTMPNEDEDASQAIRACMCLPIIGRYIYTYTYIRFYLFLSREHSPPPHQRPSPHDPHECLNRMMEKAAAAAADGHDNDDATARYNTRRSVFMLTNYAT